MVVTGVEDSDFPQVPPDFISALGTLRSVGPCHGISFEEVPAPRNIAPFAAAVRAFTDADDGYHPLATGRFVILHDPATQPGWNSTFRLVTYVRSQMDAELGDDPLLGEVVWSWVHDAFDHCGANALALNGTVTRELSETFGGLQLRRSGLEVELRASWSPATLDLQPHMSSWLEVMARCAGTISCDYLDSLGVSR
ncbi:MAG: DUF3000 domain-containing protein [Actinomycetaceae bacterium]|nr:DUF3000 domain-containing protein [Actinomycetaceae bacterium]